MIERNKYAFTPSMSNKLYSVICGRGTLRDIPLGGPFNPGVEFSLYHKAKRLMRSFFEAGVG